MDFNFEWDNLSKNLNSAASKTYEKDTRFWKISKDDSGRGVAIIRLLLDKDKTPFTKVFHYSLKKYNPFTKKYQWYIQHSPETIGLKDPVKEHYVRLIEEGTEESKKEASNFKRQTKFITNILVVNDPTNPDNNGKVFLWEFGTKVKDKITGWIKPSEQELAMGEEAKNLFHPLEGFNIKLKIQPQGEFSTYDGSEVVPTQCAIEPDMTQDSAIKFLTTKTYALSEFMSPEHYKSYEELDGIFTKYLSGTAGTAGTATGTAKPKASASDLLDTEIEDTAQAAQVAPAAKTTPTATATPKAAEADDDWLTDI